MSKIDILNLNIDVANNLLFLLFVSLTINPLRQVVLIGFFDLIQSDEGGSIQLERFYMEC